VKVAILDKEGLEAVYWIKRHRKKILGWFTPNELMAKTLGFKAEQPFQIHFTYPFDGDYHFSFKVKHPLMGEEMYENVYCDRVTRKELGAQRWSKSAAPRVGHTAGFPC
jgi:hypothetical protein